MDANDERELISNYFMHFSERDERADSRKTKTCPEVACGCRRNAFSHSKNIFSKDQKVVQPI